jgi:hypothetical protein
LAERAFSLVVPEAVKLPDALIKELLGLWRSGRDREMNVPGAAHQPGKPPWPFIKTLPMHGMAGPFLEDRFLRANGMELEAIEEAEGGG